MNLKYFSEKFKDERVIALDIETTGNYKNTKNHIIQLGTVEFINGKFVREHVKLFGGGKSIPICLKIHGITDREREGCVTFGESCHKVAKYLSNSIIVGHNVITCDMNHINKYMSELGIEIENYKTVDTYRLAKKILPLKKFNLELCCETLGLEFGKHNALGDARSSLMVLDKLIEKSPLFEKEDYIIG